VLASSLVFLVHLSSLTLGFWSRSVESTAALATSLVFLTQLSLLELCVAADDIPYESAVTLAQSLAYSKQLSKLTLALACQTLEATVLARSLALLTKLTWLDLWCDFDAKVPPFLHLALRFSRN
jgi:hypothetical protein